jgi:hypothetical protein
MCDLDLTQPDGLQKLMGGVMADKCAGFVKETARVMAEELIRIATS